jgi:Ca2+-binding EF-hand superfamily protein
VKRSLPFAAAVLMLAPASIALAQAAPKAVSRADFVKSVDTRFNAMDTNHDGVVTRAELAAELQKELDSARAQMTQKLRQQFQQLDTNKDGQLSFAEFSALTGGIRSAETPEQKLQQLDTNHDGKISAEEYRAPELAKFNKVDANHDGIVTPAEMQAASRK